MATVLNNHAEGSALPWTDADSQGAIMRRLLVLRLALFTAISAGVGFVHWGLGREPDFWVVGVALSLLVLHSGFMVAGGGRGLQLREFDLWGFLIVDAIALLLVVTETGRTANPFIYYLLVLIAVSASILSLRGCTIFTLSCCGAYSLLMWSDARGHIGHRDADYQLHLLGMWVNFVGSAVLISLALARLTRALREREIALSNIREASLRNEQLVGVGTLAASTVHALGTPLSTLSVLLGDMRDTLEDPESKEDVTVMLEQIDRCRSTMQKLSLLAEGEAVGQEPITVGVLAAMLKEHYSLAIPSVTPQFDVVRGGEVRQLHYDLLLKHALINLIDNAIQAAADSVEVRLRTGDSVLMVSIENDGSPLPQDVLARWGKPVASSKLGGLGIGVFLANSSVEKLGGSINVRHYGANDQSGAAIDITLPLLSDGSSMCP